MSVRVLSRNPNTARDQQVRLPEAPSLPSPLPHTEDEIEDDRDVEHQQHAFGEADLVTQLVDFDRDKAGSAEDGEVLPAQALANHSPTPSLANRSV